MAINWYFEETRLDSGGDPSALNFKNTIEAALREALQNAIDAKWEQNTVPVKIELIVLKDKKLKKDFLDALKFDQLRSHIQGCIEKTNTGGEILDQLKHGMKNMLKNDPLLLLKISDYTTTGLYGSEGPGEFSNSYRGLIWSKNVASDKGADSGGSFGMGKIAYSGISNIRTFLVNSNIPLYRQSSYNNHNPKGNRKLLLKKKEINKLIGRINQDGLTLIPTKMYFVKGKVKIEIAVPSKLAAKTIETIKDVSNTGKIGDGKIFILPMEDCVRIRTGERGIDAV